MLNWGFSQSSVQWLTTLCQHRAKAGQAAVSSSHPCFHLGLFDENLHGASQKLGTQKQDLSTFRLGPPSQHLHMTANQPSFRSLSHRMDQQQVPLELPFLDVPSIPWPLFEPQCLWCEGSTCASELIERHKWGRQIYLQWFPSGSNCIPSKEQQRAIFSIAVSQFEALSRVIWPIYQPCQSLELNISNGTYLPVCFHVLDYIIHNLSDVLSIMSTLNKTKGKQAICNFKPPSWITMTPVRCPSEKDGELRVTPYIWCKGDMSKRAPDFIAESIIGVEVLVIDAVGESCSVRKIRVLNAPPTIQSKTTELWGFNYINWL